MSSRHAKISVYNHHIETKRCLPTLWELWKWGPCGLCLSDAWRLILQAPTSMRQAGKKGDNMSGFGSIQGPETAVQIILRKGLDLGGRILAGMKCFLFQQVVQHLNSRTCTEQTYFCHGKNVNTVHCLWAKIEEYFPCTGHGPAILAIGRQWTRGLSPSGEVCRNYHSENLSWWQWHRFPLKS